MACETHCCVLTRGEFYISKYTTGICEIMCDPPQSVFKKVGNVESCAVDITATILGKENKYNPLFETEARTMVEGVNLTITMTCASKENLYRALYSIEPEADSGEQTDTACVHSLDECDFFKFSKMKANPASVVVYLTNIYGAQVGADLIENTDFKVTSSGIEILRSDIVMTNVENLVMVYEYDNAGYFDVDFLTQFQGYKTLFFKGTNYADDTALFDATFHKVLFAPMNQFDLISGEGFFTITLTGSVEYDKGSWFTITKQEG